MDVKLRGPTVVFSSRRGQFGNFDEKAEDTYRFSVYNFARSGLIVLVKYTIWKNLRAREITKKIKNKKSYGSNR